MSAAPPPAREEEEENDVGGKVNDIVVAGVREWPPAAVRDHESSQH